MGEVEFDILNRITLSNLSIIRERAKAVRESCISELSELAYLAAAEAVRIIGEGGSLLDVLSLLSEEPITLGAESDLPFDTLPADIARIKTFFKLLAAQDKVIFTELFLERLKALGVDATESQLLEAAEPEEVVTYVKGALAEEAYDVFSQDMKYPRVAYSADFKQACSAVKEGKAGYCILPIYEKGSYRIPSISTQLFAFDLKIVSVTPVFGMTGDADVTYGLVSSGFSVPKITEGDDRYFEILIPAGGERLLELFVAAEELEIEVYGVNSQIYEGEDGKVRFYSVTFRKSEGNFSDFIAYLILFMPDFIPTGLYLNLE